MRSPATVVFARRMALVILGFSGALIFSAVYVQPRVNAASALFSEEIRIEAPEISLSSIEMLRMVEELKEAGVVSGRLTFVNHSGIWVDANLELRSGRIIATIGSSFSSDVPDPKKATREAMDKFVKALKEMK